MKRLPVELKQQRRADHTVREGKQVLSPSAKPDKNMLCSNFDSDRSPGSKSQPADRLSCRTDHAGQDKVVEEQITLQDR
jgi:hypothetical protein